MAWNRFCFGVRRGMRSFQTLKGDFCAARPRQPNSFFVCQHSLFRLFLAWMHLHQERISFCISSLSHSCSLFQYLKGIKTKLLLLCRIYISLLTWCPLWTQLCIFYSFLHWTLKTVSLNPWNIKSVDLPYLWPVTFRGWLHKGPAARHPLGGLISQFNQNGPPL